ncbi:MAG: metallophosphoesterase [Candidatus Marinimicrobia bacterium]|nr:metallophosphoesterase [Candidatus Neomarinimicrobiota bacterium]
MSKPLHWVHISDTHILPGWRDFTWRELLWFKRWVATAYLLVLRRRRFRYARPRLAAFAEWLRANPPDVLVHTGDFSGLGMRRELARAVELFAPLAAAAGLVRVTPGNHDLYLPEAGPFGATFAAAFAPWLGPAPEQDPADISWPRVDLLEPNLALIMLNSARPNPPFWRSSGGIPAPALAALAERLARPDMRGRLLVLATHFPLPDRRNRRDWHALDDAAALRAILRPYGPGLLLHGHDHRCGRCALPDLSWPVFCAGSLTYAGRSGFWSFRWDGQQATAARGHWAPERGFYLEPPEAVFS